MRVALARVVRGNSGEEDFGERSVAHWIGVMARRTAGDARRLFGVIVTVAWIAGCFGGSSSKSAVTVVVSPSSAQVYVGLTARFTATVTGASDTSVTWEVNGKEGGNSTNGTITTTGVYTAPSAVPSGSVTITAVSEADSKASGSAAITVLPTAVVTVSPAATSVATGASQQFSATVNGASSDLVDWSVNGISGGNGTLGTIDSNGLYTAPFSPPPSGTVTITVTSTSDPSQSATATVAIPFGVGALKGQYAFLTRGKLSGGLIGRAGSIIADGEGNITGGIEDVNSSTGATTAVLNSGTYTITADGRGSLTLTNNTTGSITFYFVMVSHDLANLVESDSSVTSAGGFMRIQDSSKFSASSLAGGYVFDVAGVDVKGYPISMIGRVTSDGSGHLTNGLIDTNDNSTSSGATSFSGSSYQIDSTYGVTYGRGVASIDGLSFVFYIVNGNRWELLESDNALVATGEVISQVSPPTDVSQLNGSFCFVGSGNAKSSSSSSGKPVVRGGRFTADGKGNMSGALLIHNSDGTAAQIPSSGTDSGTYTIDSVGSGRGTATFSGSSGGAIELVFYFASGTQAVFQDLTGSLIVDGEMDAQTTTATTGAELAGSHAFFWSGDNNGRMDYSGQFTVTSASSSNVSGTIDYNQAGNAGSNDTFSGTFTLNGDGTSRNKLSLNATNPSGSFNFAAFIVDADNVFLVSTDSNDVVAGKTSRQY